VIHGRRVKILKKWLYNLDDAIATSCLALIILLTGINVISRYVFNSPFAWMQEISLGLFIWTVFIGISSTMKRDGHVGVDYFVVKMPKSLRLISNIIRAIAIIFVLIYIFIIIFFFFFLFFFLIFIFFFFFFYYYKNFFNYLFFLILIKFNIFYIPFFLRFSLLYFKFNIIFFLYLKPNFILHPHPKMIIELP